MKVSLSRVILYVQDVPNLVRFYRDAFGLRVIEEISDEWAVLEAGHGQIALHRAGEAFRGRKGSTLAANSNAKLVLTVCRELPGLRLELLAKGVAMDEIKSFPGVTGPLCDGRDPEGNVFQLAELL